MNGEILFLFVILLLALILCTYLGGANCVNKRIEGMTGINSNTYVADNGATARIISGPNGSNVLTVTDKYGNSSSYLTSAGSDINTYYASNGNGGYAKLTYNTNGAAILTVTDSDGLSTTVFKTQGGNIYSTSSNNYDNYNHYSGNSYSSIYYGPDGGTVRLIDTGNGGTLVITYKNGTTEIYYIDDKSTNSGSTTYIGPNGGTAKIVTDYRGKSAVEITGPNGSKIIYTEDNTYTYNNNTGDVDRYSHYNRYNYSNVDANTYYGPSGGSATTVTGPSGNTAVNVNPKAYYNSLPPGISRDQIPDGQEDLYILKSEVVPPVCPKCPDPILKCDNEDGDVSKCPPCEPCGRCPEPAFDCKKVPNYNAFNQNYMPVPVLNDFSSFGM